MLKSLFTIGFSLIVLFLLFLTLLFLFPLKGCSIYEKENVEEVTNKAFLYLKDKYNIDDRVNNVEKKCSKKEFIEGTCS